MFAVLDSQAQLEASYKHFTPRAGQYEILKPYQATKDSRTESCPDQSEEGLRSAALQIQLAADTKDTPSLELSKKRKRSKSQQPDERHRPANERHENLLPALQAAIQAFETWLVEWTGDSKDVFRVRSAVRNGNMQELPNSPQKHACPSATASCCLHIGVAARHHFCVGTVPYIQPCLTHGQLMNAELPTHPKIQDAGCCLADTAGRQAENGQSSQLDLLLLASLILTLRPKFRFCNVDSCEPCASTHSSVAETVDVPVNLFNQLITNQSELDVVGEAYQTPVVIPRKSSFIISDITKVKRLIPGNKESRFHCLVIDPPWENASAKRGSKYPTLPSRALLSIPIAELVNQEEGLVVLWMTNRSRLWRFVEAELLPAWGLVRVATWCWVKVTSAGQLVSPLEVAHRRPYEVALLLRPSSCRMLTPQPPDPFVFFSVPGEHSRKPHLQPLLAPFMRPNPLCAELFARELWSGWTSWGNEVLRFQTLDNFICAS